MFSPLYSAGGVHVPHPMFMSLQGIPSASRIPHVPAFHPFTYSPMVPNGLHPRYINVYGNPYNGEGPPQLRKLFIGGLSHETTDDQLRQYYSQWGTVVDCIVIRDPQTKYSRGFGFVTFATIQMAESAMANRPHTINKKVVDPKRAIPREHMSPLLPNHPPPFLEIEPDPGCKLSLSGIHWARHTVDDLRQYFDNFGTVEQVEILGNPRGLGFVVFECKSYADKCLEYGKIHVINGQKCEITRDMMEKPKHGRNSVNSLDCNFSEVMDEHMASVSASEQEVFNSKLLKPPEDGFANSLSVAEDEKLCSLNNIETPLRLKGDAEGKKTVVTDGSGSRFFREAMDKKKFNSNGNIIISQ
ncbi:unnamed protein product [Thelazia callipaeda]|uniref:RRM domain-containing protein n=1 Tax=Thelazia callipaeda TaxID=103827 RepID=A0A0N5CU44_THECL|nr:unnamed protein product [Thelazia callipaeda]